jgi:single-stranded-DNA-specific exonuclease
VGVAFKLAQALLRVNKQVPLDRRPVNLAEEDLLDLVALGTVADLSPLIGENRRLVRHGLDVINNMPRPGIEAMIEAACLRRGQIGAAAIGFALGPRLNAAGRLDDAWTSYALLTCRDAAQATALAQELNQTNDERKRQTQNALEIARRQVLPEADRSQILIAMHEEFPQGIVGLVAGRLSEEFYRPVVVIEKRAEYCRGSARSIDEFNITAALDGCRDLLVRYGGHAAAAGFTVEAANLPVLLDRLRDTARQQLDGLELRPTVHVDAEVSLADMTVETHRQLDRLEPCGIGNPNPLFLSRHVTVRGARPVGREGQHLKLSLYADQATRDAIAFGQGPLTSEIGNSIDVVYSLETNDWYGDERPQLRIEDFRPSE